MSMLLHQQLLHFGGCSIRVQHYFELEGRAAHVELNIIDPRNNSYAVMYLDQEELTKFHQRLGMIWQEMDRWNRSRKNIES